MSVLIPTFGRHSVLLETLSRLLELNPRPTEIIVVDQTPRHPEEVERELADLASSGRIRRLRRTEASIPGAMNDALCAARSEIVVFVDDDVVPAPGFIAGHLAAHERGPRTLVAGQVLQPGEEPEPLTAEHFAFRSSIPQEASEFVGCNFSAPRRLLLDCGGFDEAFVAVAYRYERELSDRVRAAGAAVRFEPEASLRHLRSERGGTRAWGEHLRTARPTHSVGEYYYLLRARGRRGRWLELVSRPVRAVRTRHHLRRPWWIPATLVAEVAGFVWAVVLVVRGPRLLSPEARSA